MKARFLALAALVLGLASCQKDFDAANPVGGGEVDFQLTVGAQELATRASEDKVDDGQSGLNSAYGAIDYLQATDWTAADLRYTLEVYDVDDSGNVIGTTPVKDRMVKIVDKYEPVVFDLRLVPHRKYRFVVFADFVPNGADATPSFTVQNDLGLHHTLGNTLADITIKREDPKAINNELTDAYFATKDITIENSATQDIVLKRPYGKLRVIATDLAELNINVNPAAVKVEYTTTEPQTFNAITGEIGAITTNKSEFVSIYNDIYKEVAKGGLQKHFYTAEYDALTAENADDVVRHTHMTLFTDYILAEAEQHSVHFTMTVYDVYDVQSMQLSTIKETVFNTDIPVERNKLTTVIGNVLTTATEIEVRIDDNFAGETVKNVVFVDSAKTLQEALDNYVNGQTILFNDNIEGNVTVNQVEGKDYVIDGNNYNYDGTITVDGNSRYTGAETLLIQNINFTTDKSNHDFIEQDSTDGAVRYAHNVTVKNCSFNATGDKVVGMRFRQCYYITVEDCVANGTTRGGASGLHSLAQLVNCTGATFDNVNVDAKNGISVGGSSNVVIKNSTIVAEEYGVRADGENVRTLTLENVNITANLPVVARKCKADYTINIAGNNTFVAPGYQVVFTKGNDDATFVAPDSNWTLNGGDELLVFPGDKLFAYNAASLQYLLDNAKDGDEILLAANIEGDVTVEQRPDVKIAIDGRNYNYAGVITVDGKSKTYTTAGITIKNLNFKAETISADACIRMGNGTNNTRYVCNLTVEGCSFNVPGAVAVKSYTGGDKNLTIKNCTGAGLHSLAQVKNVDGFTVEDVNISGGRGVSFDNSSNIVVKNSTFVAESYGIRANGSGEYTLNLENVNIKAAKPVIVRKATANYTVNFIGDNTLETSGYQVVFTTGDDEATFVAPAAYTLTGADSFRVFPRDAAANDHVYTADDLKAAIAAQKATIKVMPGTYDLDDRIYYLAAATTIEAADPANKPVVKGKLVAKADLVAKNIKFAANAQSNKSLDKGTYGSLVNDGYAAIVTMSLAAGTFEGCEFIGDADCSVGINYFLEANNKLLTVKECTFTNTFIYSNINCKVSNNTFNLGEIAYPICVWPSEEGYTSTMHFVNNTVTSSFTGGGAESQPYCQVTLLSRRPYPYKNLEVNVQGNVGNFKYTWNKMNNPYDASTITFVDGSMTFSWL